MASAQSEMKAELDNGSVSEAAGEPGFARDGELKIRLTQVLQSTLDTESLLKLFQDTVGPHVRIDGLHYQHEANGIDIRTGRQASHSCGYRLITPDDNLGELSFRRARRFAETELHALELLLPVLIVPLRNSLAYRSAVSAAVRARLTANDETLQAQVDRQIDLARRHNEPLSALLLSLRQLRRLCRGTDQAVLEHQADRLIDRLHECLRRTDLIFRNDDDEIMMVLNNTGLAGARRLAERLHLALGIAEPEGDGSDTISFYMGMARLAGTDSRTSLFARARGELKKREKGAPRLEDEVSDVLSE